MIDFSMNIIYRLKINFIFASQFFLKIDQQLSPNPKDNGLLTCISLIEMTESTLEHSTKHVFASSWMSTNS